MGLLSITTTQSQSVMTSTIPPTMKEHEMNLFLDVLNLNYRHNRGLYYQEITPDDVEQIRKVLLPLSNSIQDVIPELDPLVEPLISASMAHFLNILINGLHEGEWKVPEDYGKWNYNPNSALYDHLDRVANKKESSYLGAIHLFEFAFSSATLDRDKMIRNMNYWIESPVLSALLSSFVGKLQIDGTTNERIKSFVKTRRSGRTRGLGLLYFIALERYLTVVDKYVTDSLAEHQIQGWWDRCLSTGVFGFRNRKAALKAHQLIALDKVLPAWGLSAKVSKTSKGGRVLRPYRGKLLIEAEGKLNWQHPKDVVDL